MGKSIESNARNFVRLHKSKLYKYVTVYRDALGNLNYRACVGSNHNTKGLYMHKFYTNEREAALAVDKYLINKGKEPVNILKRK